jgi:riboflavin synthase
VNLELPTPAGRPLGGHGVQGHVDGTGQLLSLRALDALRPEISDWWLEVRVPAAVITCLVEKGSIAVEGISLTIARHQPGSPTVGIAIIPHTFRHTNLHALEPEAPLNIEADILMKLALAERLEQRAGPAPANPPEPFELTEAFLIANGY